MAQPSNIKYKPRLAKKVLKGISSAKHRKSVRKQATFALNARYWNAS